MKNHVKLPNGVVTSVNDHGYISASVHVDLSAFIDNDRQAALELMSDAATGSRLLRDVTYSVIGHCGNALQLEVTGRIDLIKGLEYVPEADMLNMPMLEFEAEVTRIGYGNRTFRLSAKTAEDARDIADDDAGNHLYSEHASDYLIEIRQISGE